LAVGVTDALTMLDTSSDAGLAVARLVQQLRDVGVLLRGDALRLPAGLKTDLLLASVELAEAVVHGEATDSREPLRSV
jgi:hypothetical protein